MDLIKARKIASGTVLHLLYEAVELELRKFLIEVRSDGIFTQSSTLNAKFCTNAVVLSWRYVRGRYNDLFIIFRILLLKGIVEDFQIFFLKRSVFSTLKKCAC